MTTHQDHIVGAPDVELERAGSGRVRRQPRRALVVADLMLQGDAAIDDEGAGRSRQGVEHQHRVGDARQLHDKGVRPFGAHQFDDVVGSETVGFPGRSQGAVEGDYALQRPGDILRGQWRTGVKTYVVAQLEGQAHAVGADVPGFRQGRNQRVRLRRILFQEHVIDIGVDFGDLQAGGRRGVQGQQIDHAHAHHQLVGGRFALGQADGHLHCAQGHGDTQQPGQALGPEIHGSVLSYIYKDLSPGQPSASGVEQDQCRDRVLASIYAKLMSSPNPGRSDRCTKPSASIGSTMLLRCAGTSS
ncbi:hypothetical protein D3C76_967040 [compost metagenome]